MSGWMMVKWTPRVGPWDRFVNWILGRSDLLISRCEQRCLLLLLRLWACGQR